MKRVLVVSVLTLSLWLTASATSWTPHPTPLPTESVSPLPSSSVQPSVSVSPSSTPEESVDPTPTDSPTPSSTPPNECDGECPTPTPCQDKEQAEEDCTPPTSVTPTPTNPPSNGGGGSSSGGGYAKCSIGWVRYVNPTDPDCFVPEYFPGRGNTPERTPVLIPTPNIIKAGQVQTGADSMVVALVVASATTGLYVLYQIKK